MREERSGRRLASVATSCLGVHFLLVFFLLVPFGILGANFSLSRNPALNRRCNTKSSSHVPYTRLNIAAHALIPGMPPPPENQVLHVTVALFHQSY